MHCPLATPIVFDSPLVPAGREEAVTDPRRPPMLALLLYAALLVLPACRKQEDYSQATPPQTSTTTADVQRKRENTPRLNPVTPPRRDMPSGSISGSAGAEQQIDLLEYSIHIPSSLDTGHHTFHVSNAGKENHGLVIEGNGTRFQLPSELTRGDTAELDADLKPGTYTAWCPVDGHKGKGMTTTFTVAAHQ